MQVYIIEQILKAIEFDELKLANLIYTLRSSYVDSLLFPQCIRFYVTMWRIAFHQYEYRDGLKIICKAKLNKIYKLCLSLNIVDRTYIKINNPIAI